MSWYYANDGKQSGPVSDQEFEAMVVSGLIKPDTLVWQEGMANWQPYGQLRGAVASVAGSGWGGGVGGATQPASAGGVSGIGAPAGGNEVICSECRGTFPRENAINYGTVWVCAACKPLFVQRLKEGAALPTEAAVAMNYAGFWIRFAARFIDGLIEGVVVGIPTFIVIFMAAGGLNQRNAPGVAQLAIQGFAQLASLAFSVAYNTFFIGRFGATPGKMAVGVKVVLADGNPVTYMRAFGRAWADRLSSLICMIGFIIAAFDNEKRALHDHICNTRVIYK